MVTDQKRVPARFWRSNNGREPVRDWLRRLSKEDRKAIGTDIMTVEFGWPNGMPTSRALGGGIFEVRTDLENRMSRVLFCFYDERMMLLHGFIKKQQKIPKGDFDLAKKRKRAL